MQMLILQLFVLILCINWIDNINKHINIDILHISDAVGTEIKKHNLKNVLLLGTKFTMEEDFYKKILVEKYGINVTIPNVKSIQNTITYNLQRTMCWNYK